MRQIEVDIDVFALIWANRIPPERSENEILGRILRGLGKPATTPPPQYLSSLSAEPNHESFKEKISKDSSAGENTMPTVAGKVRWVDDVAYSLKELGGTATLYRIYKKVEEVRKMAGRSVPKSLDATIRQTIESHSSDSENWNESREDLFVRVSRGEWALRDRFSEL